MADQKDASDGTGPNAADAPASVASALVGVEEPEGDFVLCEDGSFLLMEDGSPLLFEDGPPLSLEA